MNVEELGAGTPFEPIINKIWGSKQRFFSAWLEHFQQERLNEPDLVPRGRDFFNGKELVWYDCPCGGDHYASRFFMEPEGGFSKELSPVLNCGDDFRKQWLIRKINVIETIFKEEESYLDLMRKSRKIVGKVVKKMGVSDETYAYLWDTHGIEKEIAEEIIGKIQSERAERLAGHSVAADDVVQDETLLQGEKH